GSGAPARLGNPGATGARRPDRAARARSLHRGPSRRHRDCGDPMAELDADRPAEALIEMRTDESGAPIIAVSGELDMSNAGKLDAAVDSLVAKDPERLVFDLSGLRFMDSAGIAVLLGAAGKVAEIELRDPSPPVRRVVELTGLTRVLSVVP